MTPAEIAARLTPAQRKALLWLPVGEKPFGWRTDDIAAPEARTLATGMPTDVPPLRTYAPMIASWRLTPLGLAVRAVIEKEAARDG